MKILSTKTVFTSRYFKVKTNTIERDGKTFTKDFVERNQQVLIIPYTEDNEVYMESQFRDAHGKLCLEVVAGQIEDGSDPLETAKKELREETGLKAKTWKKLAVWDISPNMKAKIHVFAATDLLQGETALEFEEEIDVIKKPFHEVIKNIEDGTMTIATHIAALFLFDKLQKEGKL